MSICSSNATSQQIYGIMLNAGWELEEPWLLSPAHLDGLRKKREGPHGGTRLNLLLSHVLCIAFGMLEIDVFLRGNILVWLA